MKHMHFNSSCSYTALAMLMESHGIDTEDTGIAMDMGLPGLFAKEDDEYLAGPMLQGAKWFNLYLNPRGLRLEEESVEREKIPTYLKEHNMCMLGIRRPEINGKHAVVFHEYDGCYLFYNPTEEGSTEPTEITLTESELLEAVGDTAVVGYLQEQEPTAVNLANLREESIKFVRENLSEIEAFCATTHSPQEYDVALNRLFRALLLDGISMLELAGLDKLAADFRGVQKELLTFLRGDRKGLLADALSLNDLRKLAEQYISFVGNGAV